jgi:hypothetical protein
VTITSVFEKNAKFNAQNWQKSQKIAIITSTPGLASFVSYADLSFVEGNKDIT